MRIGTVWRLPKRLAKVDRIAGWQRDLASYVEVGDFLMAQGNLIGALKWYRDALAVADRLAKVDPENCRPAARSLARLTARSGTC